MMLQRSRELLARYLQPVVERTMLHAARNLELQLQLNARASSAAYVEQHMAGVESFADRYALLDHALEQADATGLYLEFGVWKGESINHIAARTKAEVHGFDSFEGLPAFWKDGYPRAKFSMKERGRIQLPRVRENVRLHVGWFDQTLPPFAAETPGQAAFLHVDCDLYWSTKTVFDHLGERIGAGTVIVFDEYFNFAFWREVGEFKAFQELVTERGLSYDYLGYARRGEQVAVKIR